jgi:peptidoglycan hydrolase-like protein with peptidoglycan-binding domain
MKRMLPVVSILALALAGCSSSWNPFSSSSSNEQAPMAAAPSQAPMAATPSRASMSAGGMSSADMTAMQTRDLKQAQRTLKAEGLYKGKVDGKSGPLTIAAIQAFQKRHGLKQTGWLDQDTTRALGSYEAQGGPGADRQTIR